jgi:hypothetical protein
VASLAAEVEHGWSVSPGHRRNITSADFTHLGSGAAYRKESDTVYMVHVFVRRAACGYFQGPCCAVPGRPRVHSCQEPFRCAAGTCR